jgi:hypothetical protein
VHKKFHDDLQEAMDANEKKQIQQLKTNESEEVIEIKVDDAQNIAND